MRLVISSRTSCQTALPELVESWSVCHCAIFTLTHERAIREWKSRICTAKIVIIRDPFLHVACQMNPGYQWQCHWCCARTCITLGYGIYTDTVPTREFPFAQGPGLKSCSPPPPSPTNDFRDVASKPRRMTINKFRWASALLSIFPGLTLRRFTTLNTFVN